MSTPLPPALAGLERALEATRAPLPPALRGRVLAACALATPAPRALPLPLRWFAASVAVAAAAVLSLSDSATLRALEPRAAPAMEPIYRCALARALGGPSQSCFERAASAADKD
jgi:hypothetical protein